MTVATPLATVMQVNQRVRVSAEVWNQSAACEVDSRLYLLLVILLDLFDALVNDLSDSFVDTSAVEECNRGASSEQRLCCG